MPHNRGMSESNQSASSLGKSLTFIDVFCVASGAMISSGIFILPGLAFAQAGPSVILSYALAGGLALIGILSVAELATAMPKAGGDYYYVTRSLGPLVGTISGLLSWFALSLKTSFAILGISEVIYLLTGWPVWLVAAPICILFTLLNIVGVKEAARLEVVLVLALLALMIAYFFKGVWRVDHAQYAPLWPHGLNAMFSTAGFVFVSFGGLLNVATMAEEVKNPTRTIPWAFITSLIVITAAYVGLLYVTVGVLPVQELKGSLTPLADTARLLAGRPGFVAVTIAAMLAFITTANAGIMAASRYPLALGRDQLLPPFFKKVSRRSGTPITAVTVTGALIFLSLLLDLELLVKAASTVVLTTYLLASISVIVLRHSGLQNYRPTFRVPGYPWLPGAGALLFCFLIVDMGLATIEISLGLLLLGVCIYFFYGRRRFSSEYALLHIVERLTSRDLSSYALEAELKEIIRDRDQQTSDAFDRVVRSACVLDVEQACEREDLFERMAQELSEHLPIDDEEVVALLKKREAESSTALSEFVAVPHIVMSGKDAFQLQIVRCRDGVHWSDQTGSVKAVFAICGTKDHRNLHLKTLAAIAHIVQQPGFEKKWLQVKHANQLRDILLTSDRKRR